MGIFVGLNYREQLQKKYGEPLVSELEQLTASITEALASVVKTGESDLDPAVTPTASGAILLTVNSTVVGTDADTNEKDLWSYSLPAGTLANDGDLLRVYAWGTCNQNGTRTRAYFGGTKTVDPDTNQTLSGTDWRVQFDVIRTGASAQKSIGSMYTDQSFQHVKSDAESPAESTGGLITIRVSGQNTAATANGVQLLGSYVEYIPAP